MKTVIIAITLILITTPLFAAEYVQGYIRSDGTYVQGHYRSSPDSSYNNNYSTKGNTNPFTGQSGTQDRTWNDNTPQSNQNQYGNPGTSSPFNSNPYKY
jgi:hypothetical protein